MGGRWVGGWQKSIEYMKPNHSLMEYCKTNAYLQLSVRICPCWRRIRREVCSQGQGQTQAGPQHDSQPVKHWRVIRFKEYDIDIVSIVDIYLVKIYSRGVLIACKIRVCVLIVVINLSCSGKNCVSLDHFCCWLSKIDPE